jgi:hypothetical protein
MPGHLAKLCNYTKPAAATAQPAAATTQPAAATTQPAAATNQPSGDRSFVIGGEAAEVGQFPFAAKLTIKNKGGSQLCTGSILDNWHVLTSAHCFDPGKREEHGLKKTDFLLGRQDEPVNVYVGKTGVKGDTQKVLAAAVYLHSMYDDAAYENSLDIALVRLAAPLKFNNLVQPVCLAQPADQIAGTCALLGFGKSEPEEESGKIGTLQTAEGLQWFSCQLENAIEGFKIFVLDTFGHRYKTERVKFRNQGRLCFVAGSKSLCQGDSGGPLLCGADATNSKVLKQFGVNQEYFNRENKCGVEGSWQFAVSVQYNWMWLTYVAYPMLHAAAQEKSKADEEFTACMANLDWSKVDLNTTGYGAHEGTEEQLKTLRPVRKQLYCRWYSAYQQCQKRNPTPAECQRLEDVLTRQVYDDYDKLKESRAQKTLTTTTTRAQETLMTTTTRAQETLTTTTRAQETLTTTTTS